MTPLDRRLPAAILLAVLLAYTNSFSGTMLFDDHSGILGNPVVHSLSAAWSSCLNGDLRPLTTLTLALNWSAAGPDVFGYHAFNVAIHALAALVLFGLVRRVPRYGNDRLAFVVSLLWAVHPLHTECVTYIVQRAQCLVGLFLFSTLYGLARSNDSPHPRRWWLLAVISCASGMASKQDMAVAPAIAVTFDRIFLAGSWKELVKKRWPVHAALVATWIVLWPSVRFAFAGLPSAEVAPEPAAPSLDRSGTTAGFALARITPVQYALTQPGVILHYLGLVLWPRPLCFDYFDWPAVRTPAESVLPVLALAGLIAATGWALFKRPELGFLGAFFFLTLAPTSSILPIDDVAAERRMYLPSAAAIALVVLAWRNAGEKLVAAGTLSADARRSLDGATLALVALILGILAFQRNEDYRSQSTMWADVVEQRPENARAWHNLAVSLVDEDRRAEAVEPFRRAAALHPAAGQHAALAQCLAELGRPGEAAAEYVKAIQLLPTARGSLRSTPAMLHFNLAKSLSVTGRAAEAEANYRESLRLDPELAAAHLNLGALLVQRGDVDAGVREIQAALAIDPDSALVHHELGVAHVRQAKYEAAIAEFRNAVEREPGFVRAWDSLGTTHIRNGEPAAAIAAYERALAVQPDAGRVRYHLARAWSLNGNRERAASLHAEGRRIDPGYPRAAADLAWRLAAHPDAQRRDPVEAVRLAELAVEATNQRDPVCLDSAAVAYAAAGRFPQAVESARAAIALFASQPNAAQAVRSRLQLYDRGEAYRDPDPK